MRLILRPCRRGESLDFSNPRRQRCECGAVGFRQPSGAVVAPTPSPVVAAVAPRQQPSLRKRLFEVADLALAAAQLGGRLHKRPADDRLAALGPVDVEGLVDVMLQKPEHAGAQVEQPCRAAQQGGQSPSGGARGQAGETVGTGDVGQRAWGGGSDAAAQANGSRVPHSRRGWVHTCFPGEPGARRPSDKTQPPALISGFWLCCLVGSARDQVSTKCSSMPSVASGCRGCFFISGGFRVPPLPGADAWSGRGLLVCRRRGHVHPLKPIIGGVSTERMSGCGSRGSSRTVTLPKGVR